MEKATAQLSDADAATRAKCAEALKAPLPAEAVFVSKPNAWPGCASYKLYSGIETNVDFEAARKCAWSERLAAQAGLEPKYTVASIFGGSAMLTVLYANGEGVDRNLALAKRFSCESGWAPAEFGARLKHLEALQSAGRATKEKFGFCDDITSGAMDGYCESYRSELTDQDRRNALSKLTSSWPADHQAAFQKLVDAESNYAELHGKGEIDLSGTSRAAFQTAATQAVENSFYAAMNAFEKGKAIPAATDAAAADAELNQVYRKTLASAEDARAGYGAVQPEGIRAAERAWVKYRDAWMEFAKLHYPQVSTGRWLELLTKDRIATLKGDPCANNPDDSDCDHRDTNGPRPLP